MIKKRKENQRTIELRRLMKLFEREKERKENRILK